MPVTIGEITSEVVLAPAGGAVPTAGASAAGSADQPNDLVIRLAVERVLEIIRREWEP
jgi:hypothetical protein